MSLANLSDLQTAVGEWLYRTGDAALAARAGDFIGLFENDFLVDPELRPFEMQEFATATLASAAVALPSDYIDMVRLKVLAGSTYPEQKLEYVTPDRAADLDRYSQAPAPTQSVARYYTLAAGQIIVTPQLFAPVGATLEMIYNAFQPLATAPGGTNWLLTKYPNLYLYGSLMQAAAYIDDNDTVVKWKAARDEIMGKLALTEKKRKLGAGPITMRPSTSFIR